MRSRAILAQVIRGWKPRLRGIPRPVAGTVIKAGAERRQQLPADAASLDVRSTASSRRTSGSGTRATRPGVVSEDWSDRPRPADHDRL